MFVGTLVSFCASPSLRVACGGCVGVPPRFGHSYGCPCVFVRPRVSLRPCGFLLLLQGLPAFFLSFLGRGVCWWEMVCLLFLLASQYVSAGRRRLCVSLGLGVSSSVRVRVRVFPQVLARLSTGSRAFVSLRHSS